MHRSVFTGVASLMWTTIAVLFAVEGMMLGATVIAIGAIFWWLSLYFELENE